MYDRKAYGKLFEPSVCEKLSGSGLYRIHAVFLNGITLVCWLASTKASMSYAGESPSYARQTARPESFSSIASPAEKLFQ